MLPAGGAVREVKRPFLKDRSADNSHPRNPFPAFGRVGQPAHLSRVHSMIYKGVSQSLRKK